MRTHVWVTIAAVICLGLATACERTTGGTVAMTTEPGPPLTTTRTSPTATASPTRTSPTADVPAPPNATTMACSEYVTLDRDTRLAVIREIIATEEDSPFNVIGPEFAETAASAMCQFMPDATVREVVTGAPPP